jgi:hypothetical protein
LVVVLNPDAPANVATAAALTKSRLVAFLAFAVGIYLLLAGIGTTGWLRSRRMGYATALAAAVGIVLITMEIVG